MELGYPAFTRLTEDAPNRAPVILEEKKEIVD
jgi:hypothetical protein